LAAFLSYIIEFRRNPMDPQTNWPREGIGSITAKELHAKKPAAVRLDEKTDGSRNESVAQKKNPGSS